MEGELILGNALLLQNVISRITHGLIGLDIYQQEKKPNEYLDDFLSLDIKEIDEALTSISLRRLVPNTRQISLEEFGSLTQRVLKAKEVIKNLEKRKPEEIEATAKDLKKTMLIFCSVYRS
jgi:hypothetical protein